MATRRKKGSVFSGKVAANAHEQKTKGSSYGYLSLPKGVNIFTPPTSGKIHLDIIPYLVTDEKHMDRNDKSEVALPGELWYKKPYMVHRGVGPNNDSFVCLGTLGKPCPICEFRAKRKMEGADEEEIKALKPSKRNLYVVVPIDVKDYEEKPHIFDISQYLFQDKLNNELEENQDADIFPDLDEGLTLRIRFTEESFGKNKYGEVSRIDFLDRQTQYGEDFLDQVPNLDEVLTILSYKELQAKFLETSAEEEEDPPTTSRRTDDEGEDDDPPTTRRRKSAEPQEEEDDPPTTRRRSAPKEDEGDEGDDDPPARSSRNISRKSAEEDEGQEEDIPAGERCAACRGTGKNSKGGVCTPCDGTGRKKKKAAEAEEEQPRTTRRSTVSRSGNSQECPHGYEFGKDIDTKKECETCDLWEKCIDAKG